MKKFYDWDRLNKDEWDVSITFNATPRRLSEHIDTSMDNEKIHEFANKATILRRRLSDKGWTFKDIKDNTSV